MSDYIRRQDAIDAIRRDVMGGLNYKTIINGLTSASVCPVVFCRDCKHHSYDEIFGEYWCEHPGRVRETTADGFCEKGEE